MTIRKEGHQGNSIVTFVILIATATLWGFGFNAQDLAAQAGIPSAAFNGMRYIIAAVLLMPFALLVDWRKQKKAASDGVICEMLRNIRKNTLLGGLIAGVLLLGSSLLAQIGIAETQSGGKAAFMSELYIILVPLICGLRRLIMNRSRHFPRVTTKIILPIAGCSVAILGLYYLSGGFSGLSAGDLFLMASTVAFSLNIIVVSELAKKTHDGHSQIHPLSFSTVSFATCGVISFLCMPLFGEILTTQSVVDAFLPLIYCSLGAGALAGLLQLYAGRRTTSSVASNIYVLEAVVAVTAEAAVFGKAFSTNEIYGFLLISIGITILMIHESSKDTSAFSFSSMYRRGTAALLVFTLLLFPTALSADAYVPDPPQAIMHTRTIINEQKRKPLRNFNLGRTIKGHSEG